MKLMDAKNEFNKLVAELNKELTKVIGKKSVYGKISFHEVDLIHNNWIYFYYSKRLTKNEEKKVLEIVEKYLGPLSRPRFTCKYKTEKGKYGLRWDTYQFLSYLFERVKK